ncbi:MAG: hypothetical protein U1D30_07310 [Planctomycetota bacterium]
MLWAGTCLLFVLYVAKILHVNLREFKYWFIPLPATYGNWNPKELPFEEVSFPSEDGTPLVGWYVPCKSPRAVLLYCHGSGGNLSYDAPLLRRLHAMQGWRCWILTIAALEKATVEHSKRETDLYADARREKVARGTRKRSRTADRPDGTLARRGDRD